MKASSYFLFPFLKKATRVVSQKEGTKLFSGSFNINVLYALKSKNNYDLYVGAETTIYSLTSQPIMFHTRM